MTHSPTLSAPATSGPTPAQRGVSVPHPAETPRTYPAFWRFGDRLFFNPTNGAEESVKITERQGKRIRDQLWRAACRVNRQPKRAELIRWWSQLTEALEQLAEINSNQRRI